MQSLAATSTVSMHRAPTLALVPEQPAADCSIQSMTLELMQPGQKVWFWMVPSASPVVEITARRSTLRRRIRGMQDEQAVIGRLSRSADGTMTLQVDRTEGVEEALASWVEANAADWPALRCLADVRIG